MCNVKIIRKKSSQIQLSDCRPVALPLKLTCTPKIISHHLSCETVFAKHLQTIYQQCRQIFQQAAYYEIGFQPLIIDYRSRV